MSCEIAWIVFFAGCNTNSARKTLFENHQKAEASKYREEVKAIEKQLQEVDDRLFENLLKNPKVFKNK